MVEESGLFDPDWYLSVYDDLRRSKVDPVRHYLEHGWREGRDPGPRFSTRGYLRSNPDVGASDQNPLLHYLEHGRFEGRTDGISGAELRFALRCAEDFGPASSVVRFPAVQRRTPEWLRGADVAEDAPGAFRIGGHFAALTFPKAALRAVTTTFDALAGRSQLSGEPPVFADGRAELFADCWFADLATLRMRFATGGNGALAVRAFQHGTAPGEAAVDLGECVVGSDLDTAEFRLRDPFFPLLVVVTDTAGQYLAAFLLAFPSLCRNGPHYPELLARGVANPVAAGEQLGRRLLALRAQGGVAAVGAIEVDTTGDDGRGWLYRKPFQAWLAQVAGCPVRPAGGEGGGEAQAYLCAAIAVEPAHPWRSGSAKARLVLKGDMLPSIARLVASDSDVAKETGGAMVLFTPDACGGASLVSWPSDRDMTRTGWGMRGGGHAGPDANPCRQNVLALRPWPALSLHPAELLCPTVGPVTGRAKSGRSAAVDRISVLTARGKCPAIVALSALELLALQDGAERFDVVFLDDPGPELRDRAADLFDTVSFEAASDMRLAGDTAAWVAPGVLLHDSRTIGLLEALLAEDAAVSASCATVVTRDSSAGGIRIFGAGKVAAFEADGTEASDGAQPELEVLWRSSYPVEHAGERICLVRLAALDQAAAGMTHRHLFTSKVAASLAWIDDEPASPFGGRLAPGVPLEVRRIA